MPLNPTPAICRGQRRGRVVVGGPLRYPGLMQELTLTIVGIDFPNADLSKSNRRMELLLCPPGEPVDLRLEPGNPHDPNAIGVWSARGIQLGYLPTERAGWIGGRMRGGEEWQAIFQALDGNVAYARIRFGGGAPTLPRPSQPRTQQRSSPADPETFYPDEDGSEWGA